MHSRRVMLQACGRIFSCLAALPLLVCTARPSQAQVPRGPVLEERLLVGLRVKTDSDRQFISRVVDLVERRILPVRLVDSAFFWARAKATRHRSLQNNPMVYFRPALILRARAIGVEL